METHTLPLLCLDILRHFVSVDGELWLKKELGGAGKFLSNFFSARWSVLPVKDVGAQGPTPLPRIASTVIKAQG
jgi:hypothetical protein